MNLQLRQSRFQNLFDRFYKLSVQLLIVIALSWIFRLMFGGELNTGELKSYFVIVVSLALGIPLWMMLYNRGAVSIVEYGLDIDSEQIKYIYYDIETSLDWSSFDGFEITRLWPKKIRIRSKKGKHIEFSYYTFSSEQRKQLFRVLSEKEEQL